MMARRVNSICEEDDGFATLYVIEPLIDDEIHRFIELGVATRVRSTNGIAQRITVVCGFGEIPHAHWDRNQSRADAHDIAFAHLFRAAAWRVRSRSRRRGRPVAGRDCCSSLQDRSLLS